jgi:hypothetical protein
VTKHESAGAFVPTPAANLNAQAAPRPKPVAARRASLHNGGEAKMGPAPAPSPHHHANPRLPNLIARPRRAPRLPASTREFSDVVELIHDAGLSFARWPAVLERLADVLGASMTCLVRQDISTASGAMIAVRADPNVASLYAARYSRLNVFAQRAGSRPAQTVMTDRAVLPKEELLATEFYADFLRPRDVHSILSVYVLDNGATRVAFGRPHRGGEWEEEHIACLRLFAPHLYRAVQTNMHLEGAHLLKAGAAEALERLAEGLIIVDANSRPLFANRVAEALLKECDGLRTDRGALSAVASGEARALRRMIAMISDQERIRASADTLRVTRSSSRRPLAVRVVPMRTSPGWFGEQQPAAIVFISDAAACPSGSRVEG